MANVAGGSYVCDRISNLPDEILHIVFSFLCAKSVVQTSVLSKRWRDLWISNPNLYLDDTEFLIPKTNKRKRDNGFVDFVNSLMIRRDGSNVQKFSLSCNGSCYDKSKVEKWIHFAIRHHVQYLDLVLKTKVEFPFSLFTCKSLAKLKLSSPLTFLELKLPSNGLQNLRVLHLHHIRFSGNAVFLCCPLLKNMSMNKCDLGALKSLDISTPELQRLVITSCENLKGCEISVSTPKLQSLEFQGGLSRGIYLNKPAPVEAIIDFEYMDDVSAMNGHPSCPSYGRISKFLRGIEGAKSLTLSTKFLEFLVKHRWSIPLFVNLKYLKLSTFYIVQSDAVIAGLLMNSPSLKTFVIDRSMGGSGEEKKFSLEFILNLQIKAKVRQLAGCDSNLKFMKFLLSKGNEVERFTLVPHKTTMQSHIQWLQRTHTVMQMCYGPQILATFLS